MHVIIDARERNPALIERMEELGICVDTRMLDIGDYIISDRVAIERKTVHDFEASLVNGRLFEQADAIKKAYDKALIVIEGPAGSFSMQMRSITGAILSLYIKYGVQVLFSSSPEETAELIELLARQEEKEGRIPSPKAGKHAYTESQFMELVVGNLPGIGGKLAVSLLSKFGSINAIANASVQELEEAEKIGKKKAERIYGIFHNQYKNEYKKGYEN